MTTTGNRVSRPLKVLQSFPTPRATTNPYLRMLLSALQSTEGLSVTTFGWRTALFGRYDVLHVHWPEILLRAHTLPRTLVRRILVTVLVLRLSVTRTPVVRTQHNLRPQEGATPTERVLLALLLRRTRVAVRLNQQTPPPRGVRVVTIEHGHYRDWFADVPRSSARPGGIVFVGLLRPYKNVDGLIRAFAATTVSLPAARLHVAGRAADEELVRTIGAVAAGDPRVNLTLRHLTDDELVTAVTSAELVVLPYREMHNSGAALLALSLGRPVLVPDTEVNRALSDEVGPGWVLSYQGDLTSADLEQTLAAAGQRPAGEPDLSRREWDSVGVAHREVYRAAAALRPGRAGVDRDSTGLPPRG